MDKAELGAAIGAVMRPVLDKALRHKITPMHKLRRAISLDLPMDSRSMRLAFEQTRYLAPGWFELAVRLYLLPDRERRRWRVLVERLTLALELLIGASEFQGAERREALFDVTSEHEYYLCCVVEALLGDMEGEVVRRGCDLLDELCGTSDSADLLCAA